MSPHYEIPEHSLSHVVRHHGERWCFLFTLVGISRCMSRVTEKSELTKLTKQDLCFLTLQEHYKCSKTPKRLSGDFLV